eukprot:TRINITY_DN18296_c0_g1_i1.p1 TRINITY_DN18296_c0_g1~~TRINITY_DN18296_c0_g1_i1.p1  ORF type:complete len:373 (+),score=74.15 TRINITY_DN18296_c0_g1_i1:64-1182(+)
MAPMDAFYKIGNGDIQCATLAPTATVRMLIELIEKETGLDMSTKLLTLRDEVISDMRVTMYHLGAEGELLFKVKNDPKADAIAVLANQQIKATGKALRNMAGKNEIENVKNLLVAGVNPNCQSDSNGNTPLIIACSMGYWKIAKVLISHNCDIEATDNLGCTALWHAAIHLRLKTLELLLHNKAEVNSGSNEGISTITQVVTVKHHKTIKVVELLLQHGAAVCNPTLINAIESGDLSVVQAVVDAGPDLDIETAHGTIDYDQQNAREIAKLLEKRLPKALTSLRSDGSLIFTSNSIRGGESDTETETTSASCVFQAVGTPSDHNLCRAPSTSLSISHNKVSIDQDSDSDSATRSSRSTSSSRSSSSSYSGSR